MAAKTTTLRLEPDDAAAIDAFRARLRATTKANISQHEAILTLIRRGIAVTYPPTRKAMK